MVNIVPPVVKIHDGAFVVELGKDYSHLHENLLEHLAILPLLANSVDPAQVVLDMRNVKTIGSALLGQLISVSKRLSTRNGSFAIVGASNFCKTAISVANLDSMLPTYESLQAAVHDMSSK